MSDSIKESTWLLTEHLRYTPLSLVDDIINSINALLYRAVSAVEIGLLNAPATSLGFKPPPPRKRRRQQQQQPQDESNNDKNDGDDDDKEVLTNGWYPEAKLEIEDGVHQLETLFEATVDKDFDKLEIYVLRNVLAVPDEIVGWIRLSHYENLDFSSTDNSTIEALNVQRRKLEETRKLHRALLYESKRNAALIAQLRNLLTTTSSSSSSSTSTTLTSRRPDIKGEEAQQQTDSPFMFLTSHPIAQSLSIGSTGGSGSSSNDNGGGSGNHRPLTTTTAFVTSQLPSLRALLESLRPRLSALSNDPATASSSPASIGNHANEKEEDDDVQRAIYIESQTRRHLIDARGLELDEQGAVKTGGEGEVGGMRRVDMESVRGLEDVVGLLREAVASTNTRGRENEERNEDDGVVVVEERVGEVDEKMQE